MCVILWMLNQCGISDWHIGQNLDAKLCLQKINNITHGNLLLLINEPPLGFPEHIYAWKLKKELVKYQQEAAASITFALCKCKYVTGFWPQRRSVRHIDELICKTLIFSMNSWLWNSADSYIYSILHQDGILKSNKIAFVHTRI